TAVSIDTYPDSGARVLTRALAENLKVNPVNILFGKGSSEVLCLCAAAYFSPGDRVVIIEPTFGEYETASLMAGSLPVKVVLKSPDFPLDTAEVIALARTKGAKGLFLCNPNNPTGTYISKREIVNLVDNLPGCLIILDEAYKAFTDSAWPSEDLIRYGNVVVLRSMTKDYGLAGLRLGYALAEPAVIANLRRVCPPWNVNSMAQRAGVLALGEEGHVKKGQQVIREGKEYLFREMIKLGLQPVPSKTNLFLVKVGWAAALRRDLLKKNIMVRDCSSFGLPEYIRLAPRQIADCRRLIEALREVMEKPVGAA
ncbi:MAG: histidinol-phosphate transaminase, partial [Dehalococcoidia bacterium]|nr:histidinol-phosphate transaminase [Dehalococcoidia bacterium]